MPQTVIYGPPATGKTFHAELFKAHYGASRVIDDWDVSFGPGPGDDDLILSTEAPADLRKRYPGARLIRIDAARSAVGLDPAPPGGFIGVNRRNAATISTPLRNSIVLDIDVDIDAARATLAGLGNGFSLSEAAEALSWDGPHAPLKKLVMTAGFLPFMDRLGRRYYAIGKDARRARFAAARGAEQSPPPERTAMLSHARLSELLDYARFAAARGAEQSPPPERTAMLSHARVSELLDYASCYGEFDENTAIGTRSSHGTVLTEGQLHAIIAYRKVLCLMPVDADLPANPEEQDRLNRMAACPCACHENRCGTDIEAACYTLALLERCQDPGTAEFIEELADRASPSFITAGLTRLNRAVTLDEEVPF